MKILSKLTPKNKRNLGWVFLIILGLVFAYPLYQQKQKDKKNRPEAPRQIVDTDTNTFEDSIFSQVQSELRDVAESQKSFQKEIRTALKAQADLSRIELERQKKALADEQKKLTASQSKKDRKAIIQQLTAEKEADEEKEKKRKSIFDNSERSKAAGKSKAEEIAKGRKKEISTPSKPTVGIKNSRPEEATAKSGKRKSKIGGEKKSRGAKSKGDSEESVYLPPSFMKADLLSGVVAPTSAKVGGKSSSPMILRINDLAVLPNEYKQNTKGCFVIAEGQADLSQERVEGRLVTLSCISKDGHSIIDEQVKGWIVDKDGRAGMRGRVVAKFGAHMARVTFAGVLEGFAEAFKETAYVTSSDSFWGTSKELKDTDASTLARAGFGGGVSAAAEELSDFYINLANQTLPVIEVGPTKEVTLVISEGVELKIAKRK
jgi:conjugal transfer pilus assembly protein TraB